MAIDVPGILRLVDLLAGDQKMRKPLLRALGEAAIICAAGGVGFQLGGLTWAAVGVAAASVTISCIPNIVTIRQAIQEMDPQNRERVAHEVHHVVSQLDARQDLDQVIRLAILLRTGQLMDRSQIEEMIRLSREVARIVSESRQSQ